MRSLYIFLAIVVCLGCREVPSDLISDEDWAYYQGDAGANQYSPLDQINTDNVHQLATAWTYHSEDADTAGRSQIQCNPLIIDGVLYGTSPQLRLFALDAATGEEKWRFQPVDSGGRLFGMGVNRGLAYWEEEGQQRIFFSSASYLYSIDADTGRPDTTFGRQGRIDLHQDLGRAVDNLFIVSNTPGIVYDDKIIIGSRVSESTGPVPGHIRAYHVRTGELAWIFHTIPQPGEYGYDTWPPDAWQRSGGANAWSGFSLDLERGIVYVPTGSASFDFYGGDRAGSNLFANCVLALDADTGERLWHFQAVHHDLWDRDLPAPPNLVRVTHGGRSIDALAQITKSGYVLLLNRDTGEPLFPIEERPVPASQLQGEAAWPTQPFVTAPPPFSRQTIEERDLARRSPEGYAYAKAIWEEAQPVQAYRPPDTRRTFIFPGFDGGGEWGGAAADPSGVLYVNSSEMPWVVRMEAFEAPSDQLLASKGRQIYDVACVACHGADRQGGALYGNTPSLVQLKDRMERPAIVQVIAQGKGVMPSYAHLDTTEIDALVAFLMESDEVDESGKPIDLWPYPYRFDGYNRFYAPDGYPAITPPWGQLTAVDLNSGTLKWQVPLGDHPALRAADDPPTGTENYGGPVVTAGDLVFIAATMDEKIRAFDRRDGRQLWEAELPAAGYATPAVYSVNGKQYVVIACGGGKLGSPSGDAYVAFALP